MASEPKLTEPRRRGLARLFLEAGEGARISNTTGPGSVYHQVADWLVGVGYATKTSASVIDITTAGAERALAEGLPAGGQ